MIFRRERAAGTGSGAALSTTTRDARRNEVDSSIPLGVEIAGQWSWRILTVAGVLFVFGLVVVQLREIVIPFMIAILISALLIPLVSLLERHRWPRGIAIAVALVGTIAIVAGFVYLIIWQVRDGLPSLQARSAVAFEDFKHFLAAAPFGISESEFNGYVGDIIAAIQKDSQVIVSGALSVGTTAGHVATGMLLTLFATVFVLIDGGGIWHWVVRLFPRKARLAVDGAGEAGWLTLSAFVKVQVFVAAVDAAGIGLGAWILGLFVGGFPLVIPITVAVFFGSFIPVVGAVVTGAIAVFVALIYLGPVPAVIMLGIVLAVQQLEGHFLQPFVMGSAVKVHPLAVVFAVAAGAGIAGIAGALFAVPLVAVLNVMIGYMASGTWRTTPHPQLKDVTTPV